MDNTKRKRGEKMKNFITKKDLRYWGFNNIEDLNNYIRAKDIYNVGAIAEIKLIGMKESKKSERKAFRLLDKVIRNIKRLGNINIGYSIFDWDDLIVINNFDYSYCYQPKKSKNGVVYRHFGIALFTTQELTSDIFGVYQFKNKDCIIRLRTSSYSTKKEKSIIFKETKERKKIIVKIK